MSTIFKEAAKARVAQMDAEAFDKEVQYLIENPYTLMENRYAAVLERVRDHLEDKHDLLCLAQQELERHRRYWRPVTDPTPTATTEQLVEDIGEADAELTEWFALSQEERDKQARENVAKFQAQRREANLAAEAAAREAAYEAAAVEKGKQPSAAKLPTENRCPSCNSPDPKRHPATQYEGEVWLCPDPYHQPSAAEIACSFYSHDLPAPDGESNDGLAFELIAPTCTCHPDEAPQPCPEKRALSECEAAARDAAYEAAAEEMFPCPATGHECNDREPDKCETEGCWKERWPSIHDAEGRS